MANIVKRVVKFSNSAHVILPKTLIGDRVRIIPLDLEETRVYDLQRLNYKLEQFKKELTDFHLSSKPYRHRLGPEYASCLEAKIESLEYQIKEAESLKKE